MLRKLSASEIKVRSRIRKDYGNLHELCRSIETIGLLHPIVVDKSLRLIAGERRLRAWKKLHRDQPIPANVVSNLTEALPLLQAERDENTCRKPLTPTEAVALGEKLEALEKPKAKQRQKAGGVSGGKASGKLPEASASTGDTRDKVGQQVGMSGKTYEKAKAVVDSGDQEAISVLDETEKVDRAYRLMKKNQQHKKLDKLAQKEVKKPTGEYDVLVIDPPWKMEKIERDCRSNQVALDYPTMTQDELLALDLPMADDCHVWLWTTHRFLPDAIDLLHAWGLKYVCTFTWHKPGGFQPVGLPQFNSEFALYARRGKPTFKTTKNFPTCFQAPRGKHSEKPEAFYDMVRRVTSGRRLDMFNRREIKGFIGWGNEVPQ